ncbi:MAG: tRNA adenosine(34) deaminase TadA [Gammaproteobacteria bacterium]|nr:tRNA adenosine(34) deaminase TadA [Gammaproteobacteria bacterium]
MTGVSIDPREDEHWMRRALELADHAAALGEVPVGAVLVRDGVELGAGWNCPVATSDPSAHAEIVALRAAARAVGNYRLPGSVLYATMEPCPMCAGAIVQARVARVVYGATDTRWGAAGSVYHILGARELNHHVTLTGGVMAGECAERLQRFFRSRRGERAAP